MHPMTVMMETCRKKLEAYARNRNIKMTKATYAFESVYFEYLVAGEYFPRMSDVTYENLWRLFPDVE